MAEADVWGTKRYKEMLNRLVDVIVGSNINLIPYEVILVLMVFHILV